MAKFARTVGALDQVIDKIAATAQTLGQSGCSTQSTELWAAANSIKAVRDHLLARDYDAERKRVPDA